VNKVTSNSSTVLEAANAQKAIYLADTFGNQVRYTITNVPGSVFNGAARIIEDGSSASVLVESNGGWGGEVVSTSASLITLRVDLTLAIANHYTASLPARGTISVVSSPTGTPVLGGTVTAVPAVTYLPEFFRDEGSSARIGTAPLQASPTNNQLFFLDTAVANSLVPITLPGQPAPWYVIYDF
jgi:hypothetical protein